MMLTLFNFSHLKHNIWALTYRDSDMIISRLIISHISEESQTGDTRKELPDD